ncbi:rhomboid family intramembrane serine protease [Bradyrhizobium manausense]|uniref:rhomboid family intramembrane serine protease n=1 Tax=Bradyrhizobium manausense TaxID=989370 RepID=UPI001FD9D7EF|nr:rhomboid family intramembrane serine protease [Bradyrhizobium manausense]
MERSEIRESLSAAKLVPDCAALHPGYGIAAIPKKPPIRETQPLPVRRFHLPAARPLTRSQISLASTQSCEHAGHAFMATNTFGRRGVVAPPSRASFQSVAAPAAPAVMRDDDESASESSLFRDNKFLSDIPFLTIGLIFCLMVIFALQRSLAVDIGRDGSLDVRSLIAQGASGYDLVVGKNEWWRIGLAPLLHGSQWHLIGNCVALFIVGVRLESLIGRGWFSLIFVASALAGEAGSLLGNGSGTVGVGASGAITGLIAALFVASFEPEADAETTMSRLKTSLFFGVRHCCRWPLAPPATSTIMRMQAVR